MSSDAPQQSATVAWVLAMEQAFREFQKARGWPGVAVMVKLHDGETLSLIAMRAGPEGFVCLEPHPEDPDDLVRGEADFLSPTMRIVPIGAIAGFELLERQPEEPEGFGFGAP